MQISLPKCQILIFSHNNENFLIHKHINSFSGCNSMLPYMLDSLSCAENNVCSCNQERPMEQKDLGYTRYLAYGSWYVISF